MKKSFLAVLFVSVILFVSCSPKVAHLYETKPMNGASNESNIFENDTVKIVYSFWSENGAYSFSVFNKLNVPLYIDWKKSSLVKNNDKLNYWSDEVLTQSSLKKSTGLSYFGNSLLSLESGFTSSLKPEQITFIAPKSTIYKIQFYLNGSLDSKLPKNSEKLLVPKIGSPKKTEKILYINYRENNTPLFFRNFMTLSTSDKFEKEFYIDNGFYVFKVSEMSINQLTGSSSGSWINLMKASTPYKKAANYYVLKVK